jgi:hypothetical protein
LLEILGEALLLGVAMLLDSHGPIGRSTPPPERLVRRDKPAEKEKMKELHVEGVATHDDPESGVGVREGAGEAKDRGTCRPGIEPRNQGLQGADAVNRSGRQHAPNRQREGRCGPARSKTPCTYGTSLRENREISGSPIAMVRWAASGTPRR